MWSVQSFPNCIIIYPQVVAPLLATWTDGARLLLCFVCSGLQVSSWLRSISQQWQSCKTWLKNWTDIRSRLTGNINRSSGIVASHLEAIIFCIFSWTGLQPVLVICCLSTLHIFTIRTVLLNFSSFISMLNSLFYPSAVCHFSNPLYHF